MTLINNHFFYLQNLTNQKKDFLNLFSDWLKFCKKQDY